MTMHAAIAMRNNKMNKTWLFTTLTLALVAAAQQASSGFGPWVGTWYVYTEYGDKIDEIVVTAKTVKTHGHLVEAAKASQGKLTFRVKSSAFTLNDAFNGSWTNGSQRGSLQKVQ